MAGAVRVVLDRAELRALTHEEWVKVEVMRWGDRVAHAAAGNAPRKTGQGAASIRAEAVDESPGWAARVSWSKERFYMGFQNDGTINLPARHFLQFGLESEIAVEGGISASRASASPGKRRRRSALTNARGQANTRYYGGTKRKRRGQGKQST